jgi:hypothetical protein
LRYKSAADKIYFESDVQEDRLFGEKLGKMEKLEKIVEKFWSTLGPGLISRK